MQAIETAGGSGTDLGAANSSAIEDDIAELTGKKAERSGSAEFLTTKLAELPPQTLMNEQALSSCLGISTRTVRRLVMKRQLPPGIKLGARRMWMAGKLVAFLDAQADRAAAAARRLNLHATLVED